jgi:glycosyltransferase involved in cell wall biosynthesis
MTTFLFAIGARDRASSRLRIWDHVEWVAARDRELIVDSLLPPAAFATRIAIISRIVTRLPQWIAAFFRADAIIIQEALLLWPLLALKHVGKRRRVAFDFSDPVDKHGHGLKGALRGFAFRRMARGADVISVENRGYLDALAGDARELRHFYGPVNAARYLASRREREPRVSEAPLRIGWTGSPSTFRFIAPLMPIIDRIAADRPIELVLIGAGTVDYRFEHARPIIQPWSEPEEFGLVPTFDLGLFRLEPTREALWRGAGKLFIYMAAGVPFVASDLGIAHGTMEESGVGYPVPTDVDWEAVLRMAVDDNDGRRAMSARSLDFAAHSLSYEAYRARILAPLIPSREAAV